MNTINENSKEKAIPPFANYYQAAKAIHEAVAWNIEGSLEDAYTKEEYTEIMCLLELMARLENEYINKYHQLAESQNKDIPDEQW